MNSSPDAGEYISGDTITRTHVHMYTHMPLLGSDVRIPRDVHVYVHVTNKITPRLEGVIV